MKKIIIIHTVFLVVLFYTNIFAKDRKFTGSFAAGDMIYEANEEEKFGIGVMEQGDSPHSFNYNAFKSALGST